MKLSFNNLRINEIPLFNARRQSEDDENVTHKIQKIPLQL